MSRNDDRDRTQKLLDEALASGPVPDVSPRWLEAAVAKLRSVRCVGEESVLEMALVATLARVRGEEPAAGPPVTRHDLLDALERGATRVTLRDGRTFVVNRADVMCPRERSAFVLLAPRDGGFVQALCADLARVEPVWPESIALAPDEPPRHRGDAE
jgi:hypothetical protein